MRIFVILLLLCSQTISHAATLHVGPGQTYPAISPAVRPRASSARPNRASP